MTFLYGDSALFAVLLTVCRLLFDGPIADKKQIDFFVQLNERDPTKTLFDSPSSNPRFCDLVLSNMLPSRFYAKCVRDAKAIVAAKLKAE